MTQIRSEVVATLKDPRHEAFRQDLLIKVRAQYHSSQRYTLTERDLSRARCAEFSKAFAEKFPELRIERGWYGGTEHWWCVTPNGEIVDPSKAQFLYEAPYRVFDPAVDIIRIGRCMNCGDDIYGLEAQAPRETCPPEEGQEYSDCEKSLMEYYNARR